MATQSFIPYVPKASEVTLSPRVSASRVVGVFSLRGGVVVKSCDFVDGHRGEALCLVLEDRDVHLWCWRSALSPVNLEKLVASGNSAVTSGAVVFPAVAVGEGRSPAGVSDGHGWFCGLSADSLVRTVPAPGALAKL